MVTKLHAPPPTTAVAKMIWLSSPLPVTETGTEPASPASVPALPEAPQLLVFVQELA